MLLLKGHKAGRPVYAVAFAPDGAALASASRDDTVRLWDLETGEGRVVADCRNPGAVAFTPDGEVLAWAHGTRVSLLKLPDGKRQELRSSSAGGQIRFSPDGKLLASNGYRGLMLWEAGSWRRLEVQLPVDLDFDPGLAFTADGRTLAMAESGWTNSALPRLFHHRIRLIDLKTQEQRAALSGHGDIVTDLAFTPDGATLLAACGQCLWAWDVATGRTVGRLRLDRIHFQALALTPDGRFLAAVRNDGLVRFWDWRTWREHAAFAWEIGPLVSLAFAPDGQRAAAGSRRGKIVVWDIDL